MNAYLIDPVAKTVTETTYADLAGLQKLVGGYIEAAYSWTHGDTLFVDEEGLHKDEQRFFRISVRPDQLLAGRGVLVGREINDRGDTAPPTLTLEGLTALVSFPPDGW